MTEELSFMFKHGAQLADNGYRPIPLLPSAKVPGQFKQGIWTPYPEWERHCVRATRSFELDIWSRWPGCGVGIAAGSVAAVDIDVMDADAAQAIETLAREMLGDTPAKRIGLAPKRMLIYRAPEPFGGMKRHPLEILGTGNQFVAYAIHPVTGQPYQWPDEGLTELDISRLPAITAEMARAFLERAWPMVPVELRQARLGGAESAGAWAGPSDPKGTLAAVTAALAHIPNNDLAWDDWIKIGLALKAALGNQGAALFYAWSDQSKKNDHKLTTKQWRSFHPTDVGAGTLYWLAQEAGWVPDASLTLNGTAAEQAEAPHPAAGLIAKALARATAAQASTSVAPEIMDLDGALGLFVDYCTRTAFSPQPFLALGCGLGLLGALAGRRYASPSDLRTNVFTIGLADSGSGKDQPRKCSRRLLVDAGLTQYLGGEELASGQAIYGSIGEFPARFYMLNEFGQMVAQMTGRNAAQHKTNILSTLTKLFTSASELVPGTEYAKQKGRDANKRIDYYQPHVCVYGDTVAQVLWKAMQSGALGDGSVARFLVFQTPDDAPDYNRAMASMEPPAALVAILKAIAAGVPGHDYGGNLAGLMDASIQMQPYVVPYGAGVAGLLDRAMDEQLQWKRENRNTWATAFIGRSVEHTIRVAMIRAISRAPASPVIEVADILWAQKLVEHCLVTAMRETDANVADSAVESNVKRLLEVVRKAGAGGITKTNLLRGTRFLDTRQRNSIVADLIEGGELFAVREAGEADKPITRYSASPGRMWQRRENNSADDENNC